jgi:hypothetical protein
LDFYRQPLPLGGEPTPRYYFEDKGLIKPMVQEATGVPNLVWSDVDPRLHDKVWVIGLRGEEKRIAYPIPELARAAEDSFEVEFEGQTLVLRFDAENQTGYALDKEDRPLPEATLCLWFAWAAAYPETDLYQYKEEAL